MSPNFDALSASRALYQHQYYMLQAIALAKKGRYTTPPNPNVGCVIVKDGVIVGEGFHYQAGQPHAEVHALRQAGNQAQGATVYVTLEPCSHYGRTPPCADALIAAKVSQVVIAVTDPNPKVAGGGIAKLQVAGIDVITGICHDEAYALNLGFFRVMLQGQPYVRLKLGVSLDGRIAMNNGESKWITNDASREDVQTLRAISGAIITSSETVLMDSPALTVRSQCLGVPLADIRQPLLVILDRRGRIDTQSLWYQQQLATRPILLIQDTHIDLQRLLRQLATDYQINDVLIEAGATLATAFLQAGLVDELILYIAPCLLGNAAKPFNQFNFTAIKEQIRLNLVSHETLHHDLKLTYRIYK